MPTSSTVWWPSMCRSPSAWMSRSIRPWRAIWSSMWSKKPMPVDSLASPVPSRLSLTVIWVSAVLRVTSAVRAAGVANAVGHRDAWRAASIFAFSCGRSDGQAQAIGQQWVHFRNVLDQHAARLHALEGLGRIGHAHQDHVGVAGPGFHARQPGERVEQHSALGPQVMRPARRTPPRAPARTAAHSQFSTLML